MTDRSVILQYVCCVEIKKVRNGPQSEGEGSARFSAKRAHIKAAARRDAILGAALEEFSARGFAAARLDDVARRANVAKGTIYLHFDDKEALFQELIRVQLNPVVGTFEAALASDLPLRTIIDQAIEIFVREVYRTHRK